MSRNGIIVTLLCTTIVAGAGCHSGPDSMSPSDAVSAIAAVTPTNGAPTILVGYYSLRGTTEKLAEAVTDGIVEVQGVNAVTKPVADITKSDLDTAHALILGSPTYFANIPGEMKTIIDNWAWKLRVDFTDKIGGAFSTGGNFTGGKEHVVISLLLYMLNNRMIVVGPICKEGEGGFGEIGASATTGADDAGLSVAELAEARTLGRRVARLALELTGNS